jgi:hypothetical protein
LGNVVTSQTIQANEEANIVSDLKSLRVKVLYSSLKRREGRDITERQIAACQLMYHVATGQQTSHSE